MSKLITLLLMSYSLQSFAADKTLSEFESKINSLREEQIQLQIEKTNLQKQLDELNEKLSSLKIILLNRAKSAYRIQNSKWGEILLNSNLSQLNTQLKVMKNMNQNDLNVYRDYQTTMRLLKDSKQNLGETEKALQSNMAFYEAQQVEFERREKIEMDLLKQTDSSAFLLKKGTLTRPLESQVSHEFGQLRGQEEQYYLLNQGQIYSSARSAPVKAVGPGVVIFRDELQRWRETLIVQHRDQYYSVYAGINPQKIKVGDAVTEGQVIGATAGSEFYFELRHQKNPINPKKWFREIQ